VTTKQKKPEPKDDAVLLSLLDAALQLGISVATARRYAVSGILPHVRIAGRIRVPSEAVAKAQREGIGR
jgi:predicted site-specific integrase-resolvase